MKTLPEWLIWTCRLVLLVGLPVALTLTNVRLLMTHTFPELEYGQASFPPDFYGFTRDDRLFWSKRSIDYILGDPGVGAVEAWKFSDEGRAPVGTTAPANTETCLFYGDAYGPRDCTYFYNDREVKHMVDVRGVTAGALWAWGGALALVALAIGVLAYTGHPATLRLGVLQGAALTWGLYIFVVAFIGLGFNTFFTFFHQVFFAEGTWQFLWSDSLIRLFPLKFWFDAFLFVGLATLAEAAIAAALAWRLPK